MKETFREGLSARPHHGGPGHRRFSRRRRHSIHTETEALRAEIIRESPDFTSTNIALTQFKADGTAERRIFADYAEHYEDGRMTSLRPRLVTLSVDEPQVKASADTGISSDAGETVHFTGNVVVTRAGDRENAPMRFETEQLTVFPDTEIFETGAPVKLVNGADVTTGIGMTFDNVERTVNIHSNVKSSFSPRNEKE